MRSLAASPSLSTPDRAPPTNIDALLVVPQLKMPALFEALATRGFKLNVESSIREFREHGFIQRPIRGRHRRSPPAAHSRLCARARSRRERADQWEVCANWFGGRAHRDQADRHAAP